MSRRYALAGIALLGLAHPAAAGLTDGASFDGNAARAEHPGGAVIAPTQGAPYRGGEGLRLAQASYQIEELQRALNELGYNAGPVDGALGPATRSAIRTYQAEHQLPVTGEFGPRLLDHVRSTLAATGAGPQSGAGEQGARGSEQDIANVQAELRRRGYDIPVVTGQLDAATEAAIRAYQRDRGLTVTGEPSERLLADLRAAGTEGVGVERDLVQEIQRELQQRGYGVSTVDGVLGPSTRDAIRTYQADAGLPITGEPSRSLLRSLQSDTETAAPAIDEEEPDEPIGGIGDWRVALHDSFSDGDHTSDPEWTVHAGEFTVRRGALFSRVIPAPPPPTAGAEQGRSPSAEEFGMAILQGVLQQALGGPGDTAAGRGAEADHAEISTAAPIDNTFRLRLDLSSHMGEGRLVFGPYQGDDRSTGYRLAYTAGERPSFQLVGVTPEGVRVIATSDRMIELEDGDIHVVEWHRSQDGQMTVTVDGREVIDATDRGFQQPFDGFTLINAGGEYGLHRITAEVPEA